MSLPAAAERRQRRSAEERRLDVVAAVIELARTSGPEGITTQAIADWIGVTHGALFRHFPDKEAMWAAVFDWVKEQLGAVIDDAFARGGDPLTVLEGVFLAHVAFVARHPGVPRILFHELQRPADSTFHAHVRKMIDGYRQRLIELFAVAKDAGQLPAALDEKTAAVLFIGSIQGLVVQSTLFRSERAMLAAARRIFPLLTDGFRGAGR